MLSQVALRDCRAFPFIEPGLKPAVSRNYSVVLLRLIGKNPEINQTINKHHLSIYTELIDLFQCNYVLPFALAATE
jgi:hypothetical protein